MQYIGGHGLYGVRKGNLGFLNNKREKKTKNRKGSLNLGLNVLFEKIRPMSLLILPFSREGEPFVLRLSQPNSIQVESDRLVG